MKKISLFWRVIICSVAVLILVTGILWLIPLKNAPDLTTSELVFVEVTAPGDSQTYTYEDAGVLKAGFDTVTTEYNKAKKFSVLRGILVGKVGGMSVADEEDEITPDQIAALKGDTDTALFVFGYSSLQTQTIRGVEFKFNRAKVLMSDSGGDIGSFTVVLYNSHMLENASGDPADENYTTRQITCYGNTTRVLTAIDEMLNPA